MKNMQDVKYHAYQPLKDNPIEIDLSGCRYLGEIHRLLKEKFGFPEYYGENWSALWDCLDGRFDDREEIKIKVYGYYAMKDELQRGCEPMLKIFSRAEETMPNVHFEFLP